MAKRNTKTQLYNVICGVNEVIENVSIEVATEIAESMPNVQVIKAGKALSALKPFRDGKEIVIIEERQNNYYYGYEVATMAEGFIPKHQVIFRAEGWGK